MPPPPRSKPPILVLAEKEAWGDIPGILPRAHPADIADVISRAPREVRIQLFSLLDEEAKADVLAELESAAEHDLLESLTNAELFEIVDDMAPDDAADVLGDLPEERSQQVLDLMEEEDSEDVRKLLEYDEETAGGIMTTDVVAMRTDQTVGEALDAIADVQTHEPFFYAYMIDHAGKLIGYVDVWELLREKDRKRPLLDLAHKDFVAAHVNMDQEQVAFLTSKYDLSAVPVIDANGCLVGRVTADDVMDVIEEEASEDIFRLAGSDDSELEDTSVLKSCMVRLPWLLITLFGGFIMSLILRHFHAHIAETVALSYFVPTVLAMGGNTGIQSSTLVVRSLALGTFEGKNLGAILLREVGTGAVMGTVCGLTIGLCAHLMFAFTSEPMAFTSLHLAAVVSIALFAAMTFATTFGAVVPLALNRMRIDPAVASGPFITITNDIFALLIYFGVTVILVGRLQGAS